MRPLSERFWEKVGTAEADECWPWIGSRNTAGYGQIFFATGRAPKKAHRVAWELLRGEIPDGLHLDHLCRVRQPKLARCSKGHEFTERNTYIRADGERNCRACSNERARQRRQERVA